MNIKSKVFVVLDPRFPGSYHYGNRHYDYRPVFIGRRREDRIDWREREILEAGYRPIVVEVKELLVICLISAFLNYVLDRLGR